MNSWQAGIFREFRLYAVTDFKATSPAVFEKIEAAYRGGADIIQLRSKNFTDRQFYEAGLKIREIARRYRKLFFVNDRVDLAIATGADGVHVGQDDLPVGCIRALAATAGHPLWVGKSTHSYEQALAAEKEGADYIGFGPVFSTPTKPGTSPVGLGDIRRVNRDVKIPVVCIGGINLENLAQVLDAGATRVAVVRAVFDSETIDESTRMLREEIEEKVNRQG